MTQNLTARHPTILVAEDNAILRLDASGILEEHG